MTDLDQHEAIQVFVGVDVGKGAHHDAALNRAGKRLLDSALPNDEAKLRARSPSSRSMVLRRIADLHAVEVNTDARDAYIIAEAARTLPPHSAIAEAR